MKKNALVIFILILSLQGMGQHRIGDFMAYGRNNGLPASFYHSILQSSDGYLWIGSSTGLVRFDGKNYKTFFSDFADPNSISDNSINDLLEDDQHNLWIAGLYKGLTRFNLRSGQIKRYPNHAPNSNLDYGINRFLKDEHGDIWIATAGRGLSHYLPGKDSFEFFVPDPLSLSDGSNIRSNHITGIANDSSDKNILWLSSYDGLYSFNKTSKEFRRFIFPHPFEKNALLPFLCIETQAGNKIWLGTWYYGVMSFDKTTNAFETYIYPQADPPNSLHYVVLDVKRVDDSTLYLASGNSGLLSFNTRTQKIIPLLTNDYLPNGSSGIDIQRISVTPDAGLFVGGNYYIYQQHSSFNRFGRSVFFPYGDNFGVEQIVYDAHRKGYWVACRNAGEIIFFDKNMVNRRLYTSEHKPDNQFLDLAIDKKQRVWVVANDSGLLLLNGENNSFRKIDIGIPGMDNVVKTVIAIEPDQDGNLWMLARNKLFYLDVGMNTFSKFDLLPDSDVPLHDITLCSGRHHDAWIASADGLFHFISEQHQVIHILPDEKNHKGIASKKIKTMTVDKIGNAWLGFENDGIQVVSVADHSILKNYNLNNGLPCMQVNFMSTDSAGGIWAGTASGLAYIHPASGDDGWRLFDREDGIKRDYIDRPIMGTEDGKLFFNIEEGMSWIDIGVQESYKKIEPVFHLISFHVDGKPFREPLSLEDLSDVEIPYSAKEIRLDFAAMDWTHPARTKYFYRIEDISPANEWIENKQGSILLTGMNPGHYLIQLYGLNGDGVKSKEFSLPILIRPPFWQRWWFISFCVISLLSLGYAIYLYRIRQFKKLQNMRNTISSNLHDDIGASLSNIHILTVLTQQNISHQEDATSYITKAGDEIQRISESLSDIVWNISPKYDELDSLFFRMKRYAADMLEGKNISAELLFPDESEKLSMPMDQRRDFYLIFKEGINNLVKYAQATEAIVNVTVDRNRIRLEINDNGKGFDQNRFLPGNGIQNMKERADKWKAGFKLESSPGKGTRILLDMNVN